MSALRLRYQTIEFGKTDIHLRTLRDNQQFLDVDGVAESLGISSATWPLFGIIWPSGLVLAHFLSDYAIGGKRILEVGCGIGLSSLLLNRRMADITATDYHPEAEGFLRENSSLNNDRVIPFVRTGWGDEPSDLGTFDLIVGSDLLYEDEHVDLLADFIGRHSRPRGEVIIVDPGRGRFGKFTRKMTLLGYSQSQSQPDKLDFLAQPFKGRIFKYSR